MSAWIVSKKHVDLMVAGITRGTRDGVLKADERDADKMGQMFVTENVASVSYRYPDDKPDELPGCGDYHLTPYRFEDPQYQPTAAELLSAIDCYCYQSCEHEAWADSIARAQCEWVAAEIRAARPNVDAEKNAQPWGWDESDIAIRAAKLDADGRCFLWALRSGDDETARAALSDWLMAKGLLTEPLGAFAFDSVSFADIEPPAALHVEVETVPAKPKRKAKAVTAGGVHVSVKSGSRSVLITDMTNAGKRGKRCRTLTVLGDAEVIDRLCTTADERAARGGCYALACRPLNEVRATDFDALCAELRAVKEDGSDFHEGTIRGVDAPRPKLTAGVRGEWSASADQDGVTLTRLNDVNEWTESNRGSNAAAYERAAKVWPRVQNARTQREASDILEAAGVSLRGWCAVD